MSIYLSTVSPTRHILFNFFAVTNHESTINTIVSCTGVVCKFKWISLCREFFRTHLLACSYFFVPYRFLRRTLPLSDWFVGNCQTTYSIERNKKKQQSKTKHRANNTKLSTSKRENIFDISSIQLTIRRWLLLLQMRFCFNLRCIALRMLILMHRSCAANKTSVNNFNWK